MRKTIFGRLAVMTVIVSLLLVGCGNVQEDSKENELGNEIKQENESTVENKIDVRPMLEAAEEEASQLQTKLTEDASLTQTDMNEISNEIYMIWDDLLNELWAELKDYLDQESMDKLLEEQRAWITEKEDAVKQAAAEYEGGSIAPLISNQKAAELTKERVYVLAEYFKGE